MCQLKPYVSALPKPISYFLYEMNAADGYARMQLTTVRGSVVQMDSPLALKLQYIGHRNARIFDFTGTGVNVSNDADVEFYEINSGALSLDNVTLNEPVKVRGFVRAFGLAPEDFDAQTLVLLADARALMMVNWSPASHTAISEVTADSMTLDLDGAGRFHHVSQSGGLTNLVALSGNPVLKPNTSGTGVYVITRPFSVHVFVDFSEFSRTLSELIASHAVRSVQAVGKFDKDEVSMTLRGMRVKLR